MNPQPVSLADELRKLIEKWRGLRKSGDAFLSVSAYGTYEFAADELETIVAHAAEQPKLTEDLRVSMSTVLARAKSANTWIAPSCVETWLALLTSPVAPPPRICGERMSSNGRWLCLLQKGHEGYHSSQQPVAPGEQPPRITVNAEHPASAPFPIAIESPAPPAQERASDADVLAEFSLRCPKCASPSLTSTNDRQHYCLHCATRCTDETALPSIATIRATAAKQAREEALEEAAKEKWGKDLLTVGWHKGEMDFGVRCSLEDLDYEQMRRFREMTVVAIGVAEDMWRRTRERSNPAQSAAQPEQQTKETK